MHEALRAAPPGAAVLVDCLTLWLSNVMQGKFDIDKISAASKRRLPRAPA